MKKIENKDTINHNLIIIAVDQQKETLFSTNYSCNICGFVIQKVDDEWFTINVGDKNCGNL